MRVVMTVVLRARAAAPNSARSASIALFFTFPLTAPLCKDSIPFYAITVSVVLDGEGVGAARKLTGGGVPWHHFVPVDRAPCKPLAIPPEWDAFADASRRDVWAAYIPSSNKSWPHGYRAYYTRVPGIDVHPRADCLDSEALIGADLSHT